MNDQHCLFEYLYRDAGNYKVWGSILLRGFVTPGDVAALRASLDSGDWFVAEQVDVPPLYKALWELSGGPTEEDHAFHEFHDLRSATPAEATELVPWGHVNELLHAFQRVSHKWNCSLSPNG